MKLTRLTVMQSKKASAIEQVLNIGSGFIIATLVWYYLITPYLGIPYHMDQALIVTTIFTVISVIRGYLWRRYFNQLTMKAMEGVYELTSRSK